MMIPPEWDAYTQETRQERFQKRKLKAKNLAGRVKMFMDEIMKDKVLTPLQKEMLIKDFMKQSTPTI